MKPALQSLGPPSGPPRASSLPAYVVMTDARGGKARRGRSEAIGHPRSDAREAEIDLSRLHLVGALHVIVRSSVDRAQERDAVDVPAQVREQFRNLDAALTVFLEDERTRHERSGI